MEVHENTFAEVPMSLHFKRQAAALAAGVVLALPASAAFFVDTTVDSPTFHRALEDFSALSPIGTAVAYDLFSFSVSDSGTYRVRSFALGSQGDPAWDPMLFLYVHRFDPLDALANGLVANDDFRGNDRRSGFDVALLTGTAYHLVTTGVTNSDAGRYLTLLRGPGEILPAIPEPGTYAMLALGLVAVSLAVHRRRRAER
jgi:PEP-CTERM motif